MSLLCSQTQHPTLTRPFNWEIAESGHAHSVGEPLWPVPPDGLTAKNLCGTTNAQGRLSNGSPEACRMNAASASGLFLHIEQHRNIRDDPSLLIQALQDVLPIQPRFSR